MERKKTRKSCPINTTTNIYWKMCLYSSAIYDVLDGKRISQRWEKEGVVNSVQNCNLSLFLLSVLGIGTYPYPFSPPKVNSLVTQVVRRDLSTVYFQNTPLCPQTNNYKITFLQLILPLSWITSVPVDGTGRTGNRNKSL